MVAAANTGANSHYDIVIVGGGMVGISLALLLRAQQPWNILLIEAQRKERCLCRAHFRYYIFTWKKTSLSHPEIQKQRSGSLYWAFGYTDTLYKSDSNP